MFLIAHESLEEAKESAKILKSLGRNARNLLSECVETTGVRRSKLSKAANDLENSGFLIIRASDGIFQAELNLLPTFAGEEALELLDEM